MQSDLRKLAELLRRRAMENRQAKTVKSAHVVQGHVGLSVLRRKLGRPV